MNRIDFMAIIDYNHTFINAVTYCLPCRQSVQYIESQSLQLFYFIKYLTFYYYVMKGKPHYYSFSPVL